MEIELKKDGTHLTAVMHGRIDTSTSTDAERILIPAIEGIDDLVLDFADIEYISSAGLRVLLSAQKVMSKKGGMKITNVSADIMEIFEVTGFSDILTIE